MSCQGSEWSAPALASVATVPDASLPSLEVKVKLDSEPT
jgi:hypothetical protein